MVWLCGMVELLVRKRGCDRASRYVVKSIRLGWRSPAVVQVIARPLRNPTSTLLLYKYSTCHLQRMHYKTYWHIYRRVDIKHLALAILDNITMLFVVVI